MERDASLGAWLTRRRQSLHLERTELAARIGCAVVTLRKIEADERRPSRQVAALLAEQLGIPAPERHLFVRVARGELWVKLLDEARAPAPSALPRPVTALFGRERDLPERHLSLRQAVGWNYGLLAPAEQRLLRRLSLFVGACSLEAAVTVCGEGPGDQQVFEGISDLMTSSLLQRRESDDGRTRFGMLETVYAYAREQLVAGGEAELLRHGRGRRPRASGGPPRPCARPRASGAGRPSSWPTSACWRRAGPSCPRSSGTPPGRPAVS